MTSRRLRAIEALLPRLMGYAMSLTNQRADAEDLVQETLARALATRRFPSDPAAARAWSFRALRNLWIDGVRRRARIDEDAEAALARMPASLCEDWLIDAITVRAAMRALPDHQREIIALIDLVGFTYAEAAELIDVPIGTVMSRLARARAALLATIAEGNVRPLRRRQA